MNKILETGHVKKAAAASGILDFVFKRKGKDSPFCLDLKI
jgi:hypothetical protein